MSLFKQPELRQRTRFSNTSLAHFATKPSLFQQGLQWMLILLSMLIMPSCTRHYKNIDDWYVSSDNTSRHTMDGYHMLITELRNFEQVSYFGDSIHVTLSGGTWRTQHGKTLPLKDRSLSIQYQDCHTISLCAKPPHANTCQKIFICYADDLLMIGPERGSTHELLRIYRSPLWHHGFDYHPLRLAWPVNIDHLHISIALADRQSNPSKQADQP